MRIKEIIRKAAQHNGVFSILADIKNDADVNGRTGQFAAFRREDGSITVSLETNERIIERSGLTFMQLIDFVNAFHLAHRAGWYNAY